MELGLTWPLARKLRLQVPYGTAALGDCWDAHVIALHGRESLLLVHAASRFVAVAFDLTAADWADLPQTARFHIDRALRDAGMPRSVLKELSTPVLTRTHGRRPVAFLNRAWDDVLALDTVVDRSQCGQPLLEHAVNEMLCRCAGCAGVASAREHLLAVCRAAE